VSNPLIAQGDGTKLTEGAGLLHDAAEVLDAAGKGNWTEGLMNFAGGAMGVAGFLADPLAGLVSMGFGWLMEHVSFLHEPLDWLTGDQETLDGMSKTWGNISNHLEQVSTDLKDWVGTDSGQWLGREFRAYEGWGKDRAETYGSVATGAQAISVLVNLCKTIMNVVRGIVRDLISEAVGKLVSICLRWAPAVAAFGAGVAGAIAECIPTAIKYANKALEWCRKLTKAFSNATGLFKNLEGTLGEAIAALSKKGDDAVRGLQNWGVAQALTTKATDLDALKYGVAEAKKVIVDGATGVPKDIVPKLGMDLGKEAGKVFDSGKGEWFDFRWLEGQRG
jgi:hypothetical protein